VGIWYVFSLGREFNAGYAQEQKQLKSGRYEEDAELLCVRADDVDYLGGDSTGAGGNSMYPMGSTQPLRSGTVNRFPAPQSTPAAQRNDAVAPSQVLMDAIGKFEQGKDVDVTAAPQAIVTDKWVAPSMWRDNTGTLAATPKIEPAPIVAAPASPSPLDTSQAASSALRNVVTPVWLHPNISKADADDILSGCGDGTFLIRRRAKADEFVLSVVYMDKATHHLVAPDASGILAVNKHTFGDQKTIHSLVDALRLPRADWPVPLATFVPNLEATKDDIERENQFVARLTRGKK
jgi:hypothetical protein